MNTLTRRFAITALVLSLLVAAAVAVVSSSMRDLTRVTDYLTQDSPEYLAADSRFNTNLSLALYDIQSYGATENQQHLQDARIELDHAHQALSDASARAKGHSVLSAAIEDSYRQLSAQKTSMLDEVEATLSLLQARVASGAPLQESKEAFDPLVVRLNTLISETDLVRQQTTAIAIERTNAIIARIYLTMIVASSLFVVVLVMTLWWLLRSTALPLRALTQAASALRDGQTVAAVEVTRRDDVGNLQRVFNDMAATIGGRTAEVERRAAELAAQNEQQQQLIDLVNSLETSSISLTDDTLLAPIVGTLDGRRTQMLTERLLRDAYERRTKLVIMDITGVSIIDTYAARGLLDTANALRLLGCKVALSGVSAATAATLVQQGVSLEGLITVRTPQDALLLNEGMRA